MVIPRASRAGRRSGRPHRAPGAHAAVSPLRGDPAVLGLVHDAPGLRALRALLRAGAGLLGGRDLRQLRGEHDDRDRGLLHPVVAPGALDGCAVRDLDPVPDHLPVVVLPLQPERVAGAGVLSESGGIAGGDPTPARSARRPFPLTGRVIGLALAMALLTPLAARAAYEEGAVADGGVVSGTVKFVGTAPKLEPIAVNKNRDVCGERSASEALLVG